jgi:hypothetical protein
MLDLYLYPFPTVGIAGYLEEYPPPENHPLKGMRLNEMPPEICLILF